MILITHDTKIDFEYMYTRLFTIGSPHVTIFAPAAVPAPPTARCYRIRRSPSVSTRASKASVNALREDHFDEAAAWPIQEGPFGAPPPARTSHPVIPVFVLCVAIFYDHVHSFYIFKCRR